MLTIAAVVVIGVGVLWFEGRTALDRSGEYVALGSSFAAGPGLGSRAPGSPHACGRGSLNYAHSFARAANLRLVDVSCGGATSLHLLNGGQLFQGPQVDAVGPSAKIVMITIGGNDISYIGDLGLLAMRSGGGMRARLVRWLWTGPKSVEARPFLDLTERMVSIVTAIRARSPKAIVVLITYPQVLPPTGTCPSVGISETEATLMREVAGRLAQATRDAAVRSGAIIVDMDRESAGHDACSPEPWVNGVVVHRPNDGAMFHPTRAGMAATASAIGQTVGQLNPRGR